MSEYILAIILSTLLMLVLVTGVIITMVLASKQRIQQEKKLSETKLTFEKELRKAETEVSEQMMQFFSRELHDNIGQLLTATHIQLETLKLDNDELEKDLEPIEIYLGEIISQMRLMSRTMNYDFVGQTGLAEAVKIEIDRLKLLKKFEINFQQSGKVFRLEKDQELMMFRIFQEAVQNAMRHSGATKITINLAFDTKTVSLSVEDNGKGFDVESKLKSNQVNGLLNMINRSEMANLSCQITSVTDEGTVVVLKNLPESD